MPKLFDELIGRLFGALLNQAIWVCLIGSMFSSFVIVLLTGFLIGVLVGLNTFPWFQLAVESKGTHAPALLWVVFVITVISIWAITYWFVSKKFEDIYTRLRSRLVGTWGLKLQTWRLAEEQKWVQHFIIYPIHLFIDQKNRQLKARIQQINCELFEDQDIHTGNIHIDEYQHGYVIHIIVNTRQELREPYNKYQQDINMTLLLSLKIKSDYSHQITHMRGVWYDVENVLWQLHAAINTEDDMNSLYEAFGERANSFQGAAIADRSDNF